MDIKEYFARMCAAGLMQMYDNIFASSLIGNKWQIEMWNGNNPREYEIDLFIVNCKSDPLNPEQIQLRKDLVNLYELEWKKPTDKDIGKMCWFKFNLSNAMVLDKLKSIGSYYKSDKDCFDYCLLAEHGHICPTEADFVKVYGR